jgi:hypothetical protein
VPSVRRSDFPPAELHLRAFAANNFIVAIAFAIILRVRILLVAPLKPEAPLIWLLTGMLQGLAITAAIFIVIMLIFRGRWAGLGRGVFITLNTVRTAIFLAFSEAILYFGHAPHAENFSLGMHPRLLVGSLEGGAGQRMVVILGCYVMAVLLANWRANHATATWVTIPRLLIIVVAGTIATLVMPYVHLSETSRSPVVQLINLMMENRRAEQLQGRIQIPRPTLPITAARELMPALHNRFIDDRYPLAYVPPMRSGSAPRLPRGVTPDVVVILMESFRAHEVGAYGTPIPGMTPNFDALATKGFLIEDAYSAGGYTPEGELGAWYGLLASPYEIVIRNRPEAAITGLPDMLEPLGYKMFWAHPGDQTFYLSSRFYEHRGFRVTDGTSFNADEPRTNWGFSDRALARHMIALLDHAQEPFAAMELTISNHHPYQLPSDATPFQLRLPLSAEELGQLNSNKWFGQRLVPMLRTIHYSDEALGDFFRMAQRTAWFNHTIFVIVGDHGNPVPPIDLISSDHELLELRHKVAMLIYSPMLKGGYRIPGPASHADIEPTIAGLLGIRGPRSGVGVDLLDPVDRDEDRPVFSWTPESHTINIHTRAWAYHAVVEVLGKNPVQFSREILIDRHSDPAGMTNVMADQPTVREHFKRLASIYFEIYPYLIATGRSGLPPAGITKPNLVAQTPSMDTRGTTPAVK